MAGKCTMRGALCMGTAIATQHLLTRSTTPCLAHGGHMLDYYPLTFDGAGTPADGADGADVVFVCDPSLDTLLQLHQRNVYTGRKGANGNPAVGSSGPKRNADIRKAVTPPLEIGVPPGTVVKRKSTGQVSELVLLVVFDNGATSGSKRMHAQRMWLCVCDCVRMLSSL